MNWQEFERKAPQVARPGKERFERTRLALIGTLKRDGWPRISPVEPLFLADDLVLGMIWNSTKTLDLLRDPRCVLHSVVTDPDANEGEFKLYGIALPVEQQTYLQYIREHWKLQPNAPLHAFRLDIQSASFTTYDFDHSLMHVKRWDPITGLTQIRRPYP